MTSQAQQAPQLSAPGTFPYSTQSTFPPAAPPPLPGFILQDAQAPQPQLPPSNLFATNNYPMQQQQQQQQCKQQQKEHLYPDVKQLLTADSGPIPSAPPLEMDFPDPPMNEAFMPATTSEQTKVNEPPPAASPVINSVKKRDQIPGGLAPSKKIIVKAIAPASKTVSECATPVFASEFERKLEFLSWDS